MTPYYQDEAVTIYHGDCRELRDPTYDVLVTDPPYGVGFRYADARYQDDEASWLGVLEVLTSLVNVAPSAVCMSFSRLWELPPARWAACWYKPGSVRRSKVNGWSTWEPILLYGDGWRIANDLLRLPDCVNHTPEAAPHPCPKPVSLFRWLIGGAPQGIVFDPFMGSGTTLRAAKDLGRRAVGIELEERYCEVAAKRMAQEVLAV